MSAANGVVVVRTAQVGVLRLFSVVTDWPRHADFVPLTSLSVDPEAGQMDAEIDAVTGVGPLAFHDRMTVSRYRAPTPGHSGYARLDKHGPLLAGWAEIEVHPDGATGSRLVWRELIRPRLPIGLARFSGPVADLATRAMVTKLVTGLVREAEQGE